MPLATKIPKPNAPDRSTAPHLGWYNCYICFFLGIFVVDIVCCASFLDGSGEVEKHNISQCFHAQYVVISLETGRKSCMLLATPPQQQKELPDSGLGSDGLHLFFSLASMSFQNATFFHLDV